MRQRQAFVDGEADRFFERNRDAFSPDGELARQDPVLRVIRSLGLQAGSVLEIGAGNGWRLAALGRQLPEARLCGVEPSPRAVSDGAARFPQLDLRQGTAESLPLEQDRFDLVILGFFLYLCDREDLFRIASETHRVLNEGGHLVLLDFFAEQAYRKSYAHLPQLSTYKMDYSRMFLWNPAYSLVDQERVVHDGGSDRDDDAMRLSVLRLDTASAYPSLEDR